MAYESVKNQIDAYIKANGVNLITGPVLNAVLTTMLDELGEGYAFQGVLDTTDTPSPAADIPQAWLASAGTYLGGSITVDEGELALIIHTSDGWSKETVYRGVQLSYEAIVAALGYTPADDADLAEKQDTISDLSAIRSGAALGSTSVQPADIENMVEAEPIGSIIPPVNPSEFATKESVDQLGQEVSGVNVTESVSHSGTGWLSIALPIKLKAGKKYTLVFTKNVNSSGMEVSTSTSASSTDRVDIGIVTLAYLGENPTILENFAPTGDASYILIWDTYSQTTEVSVVITAEGMSDVVAENSEDIDTLKDDYEGIDLKVNGLNMTASGAKTGSGWLSVELPNELETGKKHTLVFTKNVNMDGVSVSTSTSSSSADRVDKDIVTLDYLAQNTTTFSDFIPSGNAKFLLFWCSGDVQIDVNVTREGLSDAIAKNKTDISALGASVDTINGLIPALGKGETQTLSPTAHNGRINPDGEIIVEQGSYYTDPIAVTKGDVIILDAFVNGIASPISKTDASGSYYVPLFGVGKGKAIYTYYVLEDGYVALSYSIYHSSPTATIQKTSLSSLVSLANGIASLQEQIDELSGTKDYSATFPDYVFGIESGSFDGREYATMIYPEAIINKPITPEEGKPPIDKTIPKGLLNGTIRMAMQKPKQNTTAFNYFRTKTETIAKSSIIGGPGLVNKTFNFNYIRANRYNGQNKRMFLLVVGASITQQGGYVGQIDRLGDMDNTDIGGINVKSLGSNVGTVTPTITYEYRGQTKTITTHTEGRAGWTTYGIANWPFEGRMDGAVDTLGGEGMWYASGMATKTPFDSNTPGQSFESWTGSATQKCALFSAVFGRYKPDYCEELWVALHNFHTRFRSGAHTIWYYSTGAEYVSGAAVPAYNGATSNALMEQFFDAICNNPDNVFYDRDRARAYTGSHVWTHKTAFSIEKWVERYRTLDDNGNLLTLGNGTGTFVTESNINNPVCTPTFVLCGMGANDYVGMNYDDWALVSGTRDAIKTSIVSLLDDLHDQLPAANLGYCVPRQSGVFFPELWSNIGIIGEMGYYTSNRSELNTMMMGEMPELAVDNDYNYVPLYFTSSPVSGQSPHYVGDFDNQNGDKLVVSGPDLGHVGTEWEISVAYQILAWMYWCLQ